MKNYLKQKKSNRKHRFYSNLNNVKFKHFFWPTKGVSTVKKSLVCRVRRQPMPLRAIWKRSLSVGPNELALSCKPIIRDAVFDCCSAKARADVVSRNDLFQHHKSITISWSFDGFERNNNNVIIMWDISFTRSLNFLGSKI